MFPPVELQIAAYTDQTKHTHTCQAIDALTQGAPEFKAVEKLYQIMDGSAVHIINTFKIKDFKAPRDNMFHR